MRDFNAFIPYLSVSTYGWRRHAFGTVRVLMRKLLHLERFSLYKILQVLSVSPFCYDVIQQLFTNTELQLANNNNPNQLFLFDL